MKLKYLMQILHLKGDVQTLKFVKGTLEELAAECGFSKPIYQHEVTKILLIELAKYYSFRGIKNLRKIENDTCIVCANNPTALLIQLYK